MRSGGGLLVTPLLSHSVDVHDALGDLREQFGRVEPAEALLRGEQGLLAAAPGGARCLSLADYVMEAGATRGATAAGGC